MFLFAAISLGFLGSFHCIGMCGPIALAIPVKRDSTFSIISGILTYNFGRIISYSTMGFVLGFIGKGFMLAGWQNTLSILLGSSILFFLIIPQLKINFRLFVVLHGMLEKLKIKIRTQFGRNSYRSLLLIGFFNGLLPCGFVYLAIAGALATCDILKSTFFMAGFGLGTLPAMLFVSVFRDYISLKLRKKVTAIVPFFLAAMGIILVLRGMNLDIPYISPAVDSKSKQIQCCHKK